MANKHSTPRFVKVEQSQAVSIRLVWLMISLSESQFKVWLVPIGESAALPQPRLEPSFIGNFVTQLTLDLNDHLPNQNYIEPFKYRLFS
jgi:hypothetical protein